MLDAAGTSSNVSATGSWRVPQSDRRGAPVCAARAIKLVEVQAIHHECGSASIPVGRTAGRRLVGVDVNIALESWNAPPKRHHGVGPTLDLVPQSELDALGVVAKRFATVLQQTYRHSPDLAIYRLKTVGICRLPIPPMTQKPTHRRVGTLTARIMERATRWIMVAGPTLDLIPQNDLDVSGVVAKRARRPAIPSKLSVSAGTWRSVAAKLVES